MPDSPPDDVVDHSATNQSEIAAETSAAVSADDNTPAASSTPEKPAVSMLDTVKAALKPKEDSPTSEEPDLDALKADDPAAKDAVDPDELSAEEKQQLSTKTQARFKKLTSESKAKDATIESLRPKAAEYDKIDQFIANAGLSRQDVGSTLQIAAMLRSNPQAARERLRPIMVELDRILGETLPTELQTRVDQGYLTEEDARALSRANAANALNERRLGENTQQQQFEHQVREQKQLTDSTLSSVATWEAAKAAKDPDWHLKRDDVAEQVELAIQRKSLELKRPWFPNSEEAVKLSEDALAKVGARMKRFGPKLTEVRQPAQSGASPRTTPAPKNMLEVVRANIAAA